MNQFKKMLVNYDNHVLSGLKTYITVGVLFAAVLFMPESKLTYFVGVLGITHLFGLGVAKYNKDSEVK